MKADIRQHEFAKPGRLFDGPHFFVSPPVEAACRRQRRIRVGGIVLSLFLAAGLPLLAAGQTQRAASSRILSALVPKMAEAGGVTVRLISLPGGAQVIGGTSGDGVLDFGRVSYFSSSYARAARRAGPHALTTTTEFGIELDAPASSPGGAAMLGAYLAEPSPNCAYLIDGIRLTTAPQVISARENYGVVTRHRLEIQVPKTAPAGRKRASILWTVTPEE